MAVKAFRAHAVSRIVLTRPAVEAGERLGFLPGDLAQKVDPYLRPLYDALYGAEGIRHILVRHEQGKFKLLGWKVWALEAMAALALYSVGRELALWEKAWTLRNALFGLSTLAMLTALLGLPFLYRASQYKMLELEQATYAGIGRPLVMRFLLLLAGETILLGVLVLNVRAAVPWSIGQLLAVLTVPFLTANNELLLLLRWVRPEWMMTGAVPLFAGQLCLLRFVQLSELPKGLPLAAGVLVLCMVLQCIRLAARSEYIAEA